VEGEGRAMSIAVCQIVLFTFYSEKYTIEIEKYTIESEKYTIESEKYNFNEPMMRGVLTRISGIMYNWIVLG